MPILVACLVRAFILRNILPKVINTSMELGEALDVHCIKTDHVIFAIGMYDFVDKCVTVRLKNFK